MNWLIESQAFFINLVIGGSFAPVYLFLLPSKPGQPGRTIWQRLKTIDLLGTILVCGMFAAAIMGISFGGTLFEWNSGSIIGLFTATGVLLLMFLAQQAFAIGTSSSGMLFPIQFLRSPIMIMMFLATACASTAIFVPVYFVPLFFQFVHNDTALRAGVNLLPYVAFNVTAAILNGAVMSKRPYYMPWYLFAGILCTIGSALMFVANESTASANIWGFTIILGTGAGAFVQLSFTVVQSKSEKHLVPVAVGFCTFAQLAGPAFALCIANAVWLNEATDGILSLAPQLSPHDVQSVISQASLRNVPILDAGLQEEALHIVVKAMSKAYVLSLCAGALTVVMALFMGFDRLSSEAKDS